MYGKEESKLFCNACREELAYGETLFRTMLLQASINVASKEKLASRDRKERDITKHLEEHVLTHPVGETLPMEQRVCI